MPDYNQTPQFNTAQYSATPSSPSGPDRCFSCTQPIAGQYYRVNGKVACNGCAERLRQEKPNTHAAFMRGLLFGAAAALVGLILYAGFTIATGFYIGYVALGVGWMVGKAIMAGSRGIGGRRFQIAAVLLTYFAISMSIIPIAIHHIYRQGQNSESPAIKKQPSATPQSSATGGETTATGGDATPNQEPSEESKSKPSMSFGAAVGTMLWIGLASPFLELQDPVHGVIGLIILLVGIRIAWKITQDDGHLTQVEGPYNTSATSA